MSEGPVVSLFGHPTGERKVSEAAVSVAQEALEQAAAGEVIGMVVVKLHHDGLASFHIGGRVGGYSIVGAMTVAQQDLVDMARGD